MSQPLLITPAELGSYGADSDFREQFTLRAIKIVITTPGALGTMAFTWQIVGDDNVSNPVPSEAGAPWPYELRSRAWCTLTFADGAYAANATYTVSRTGVVSGPDSLITATRRDVLTDLCSEVTSEGVALMACNRIVPPVTSPGPAVKGALGRIVVYRAKSLIGLTPGDAGSGDGNIIKLADDALKFLSGIGANNNRPPDLIDSSPGTGAGIPLLPCSDDLRGW